ncbi:PREDICTED: LOB domain-containing protein 22 [Tarenaya hassleriana]|uniref:LOB domain-containing protein 22 n=1 Tax=Tarenaya hassleriana TaxID=28532 RepID=UPI00053C2160|nr:PREDICTED: LOB domain-containing protein 22 [Tarenaya hassleriana]XP_010534889.1 PREDICTED: LOB domain-containing protein 22 [Tarenaya hassleriana]XP_010534890.1 PREDICTED: LOB domain-containing protein 22 [Tarenaya hassleriana]XP_010534891.1 PREDICTED: LOB domain-containing protein 22 [Tarenaya hassleriana]XP_019057778.1 PREDICTED: LOB domain-containing protein 22 [Tarenaya hassleriana]
MPSGSISAFPSTLSNIQRTGNSTGGTNQACAACKYQRRKCAPDCLLAPYFPHDRHRQFLNAHKLFGVSNITKIIRTLNLPEKDAAMNSIMFQSDARAKDPVGGCYRIIRELQYEIECTRNELDLVLQHLALFRECAHQEPRTQIQEPEDISSFSSSFDLNNSLPCSYPLHEQAQEQQFCTFTGLQEDMWCLQLQESSTTANMEQVEDVSSERHEHVEFEHEGFAERNLNMASAQLIISS